MIKYINPKDLSVEQLIEIVQTVIDLDSTDETIALDVQDALVNKLRALITVDFIEDTLQVPEEDDYAQDEDELDEAA